MKGWLSRGYSGIGHAMTQARKSRRKGSTGSEDLAFKHGQKHIKEDGTAGDGSSPTKTEDGGLGEATP